MQLYLPLIIGFLMATGTYLILQRSLVRFIIGLSLISHATNLILITSGWTGPGQAPLLEQAVRNPAMRLVDPIPQALILTAIVISFGTTAFLLVLALRTYRETKLVNVDEIRSQRG
jgi:multicomponent Na+:H+ antiporter subunit C